SLGCILYELYVGKPPFCTNSIFKLVKLITTDPVRWIPEMNPLFKDLLQGLLTKDPSRRLGWPELLRHPFVASGIVIVQDDDVYAVSAAPNSTLFKPNKQIDTPTEENCSVKTEEAASKTTSTLAIVATSVESHHSRISQDFTQEFPDSNQQRLSSSVGSHRSMEEDDDDDWQSLCDELKNGNEMSLSLKLLQDDSFVCQIQNRFQIAARLILRSMTEGSSRMRILLHVVNQILCKWISFVLYARDFIHTQKAAPETDFFTNICDILATCFPKLLCRSEETTKLHLKQQTLLCIAELCTAIKDEMDVNATKFFQILTDDKNPIMAAILQCLTVKSRGNIQENMEIENLHRSCLLALKGVAEYFAERIVEDATNTRFNVLTEHLSQPETSLFVLKILFSCCEVSSPFCHLLMENECCVKDLLFYICGEVSDAKIDDDSEEVSEIVELSLHVLSIVIMQEKSAHQLILEATDIVCGLCQQTSDINQSLAAAFLLSQLLDNGADLPLKLNDVCNMAKHVFSDFAEETSQFPLSYGTFDGVFLLLRHAVELDENWYCSDLWDSGMWSVMWQTLAWALREDYQCLQTNTSSTTTESGSSNADQPITLTLHPLISPVGLAAVFDFLVPICNDETSQFVSLMMESGDQPLQVLISCISCRLLDVLSQRLHFDPEFNSHHVILSCIHLLIQLVTIDASDDFLDHLLRVYLRCNLISNLIHTSMKFFTSAVDSTELWLLIRHLVLRHRDFVLHFYDETAENNVTDYIRTFLDSEQSSSSSIVSVLICLNQLLKVVSRALPTVVEILLRDQTSRRCFEALLKHSDAEVRTCTCSIIANLLKDASNDVVEALNDDDNQCGSNSILTALVSVVEDEDENASKEAIYAVGSAFCHSPQPLPRLESSIAPLLRLMYHPDSKLRVTVIGVLRSATNDAAAMINTLQRLRVVERLLGAACHDPKIVVQEAALQALQSVCSSPVLRQDLVKAKASEKLKKLQVKMSQEEKDFEKKSEDERSNSLINVILTHCTCLVNGMYKLM
uniref:non-specific serine/threonine protein kinase n=1 Tax=Strigamia maritima TaxID=126957 RepID=T1IVZ3_STRMM